MLNIENWYIETYWNDISLYICVLPGSNWLPETEKRESIGRSDNSEETRQGIFIYYLDHIKMRIMEISTFRE